jgi:PAS domain S-box-containing protein
MKLRDIPIQRKLLSVILMTCAAVLALMCGAYIVLEYYTFRRNLRSNVETLGSVIASNSTAALAFLSQKDANEILNALRAEPHIVAACLYDKDGKIFAIYPSTARLTDFPFQPVSDRVYKFSESFLTGYQPVLQGNERLGTLYIKSDLKSMYSQLKYYGMIGLLLILGSMFVAYILSKLLQKTISEPILALEQTAKMISLKRDYSVRAEKHGNDEVGELTQTFNLMLEQIQRQNEEITAFNQNLEQKIRERTSDLQQQKDFIETIINSSVDLIAVFDTKLNYIMLNKKADEYYPLRKEEVIGKNILEIYPHTQESGMLADLHRALKGETIHNINYNSPLLKRSFENFYIPLKDHFNHVYGVLAIGHDISDVLETNAKLESLNAELVKSNRDLEQFAYVASHDLQEPLRKIQTFTQLLGNSFGNEEKLRHYHEKINQSAFRMQQLIQDVLNFSRISNSDDAMEIVDLNQIIENLKIDFELMIREKDAVINSVKLPVIKGIPLQLTQLFSNLISNSLKYNDKKPFISITYDPLSPDELEQFQKLDRNLRYIRIRFSDNGIGFEEKFSEQIFNIFQRLHGKQAYSGTGIGLAICKKIVENHKGIIYAKGKPGEGAVFTVILPL